MAGFDFKGGLIRGGNDEFVWDAYFRYSIGGSLGTGAVTRTGVGTADLEISVAGVGTAIVDAVAAAILELATDGRIEALLDGAGSAVIEFTATGEDGSAQTGEAVIEFSAVAGSAYSRTRIRVITNQKNANRGDTAVGSRASGTLLRSPRSHTEVTNG
jgi:hypothetical protein